MQYLEIMLIYFFIGCLWAIWLEGFTTRNLEDPYNRPWVNGERVVHIFFWPVTLAVFLCSFLSDLFKK
jgi:uncharacterized SAM-binding protein YcdF (DUF218 family)